MPSLFGHLVGGYAAGTILRVTPGKRFMLLALGCSILPDLDVLTFAVGIPYESIWGHRGFSHSILFAIVAGSLLAGIFFRSQRPVYHALAFSFLLILHAILDAFTTGGLGCGFFIPWDNTRYFLPWQVIKVSPFGLGLLTERGLHVLYSEFFWIGLPVLLLWTARVLFSNFYRIRKS